MFSGELFFLRWLEGFRTPLLNRLWEGVTLFGEDTVMIVLIAIVYFMIDKKLAHRICFLIVTSLGINGIFKNILKIPRPFHSGKVTCVRPETATGYSFPSGHTQNFTTTSFAFVWQNKRRWLWLIAILGSLLVGLSRLCLGAHYPSDVIVAWILGVGISYFGTTLHQRCFDKNKLYRAVFYLFTPFFVFFLIKPDPLFEDFFKCYGLFGGFLLSLPLEKNYGDFSMNAPVWKKFLRVVFGVALALLFKEGIHQLWMPGQIRLSLLWDSFRYFILVLVMFGTYPVILKKINL